MQTFILQSTADAETTIIMTASRYLATSGIQIYNPTKDEVKFVKLYCEVENPSIRLPNLNIDINDSQAFFLSVDTLHYYSLFGRMKFVSWLTLSDPMSELTPQSLSVTAITIEISELWMF